MYLDEKKEVERPSEAKNDKNRHFPEGVDRYVKLLKTKAFKLEKVLDTAFHRPIRFRQISSDGLLNIRWNYSPLKEKAIQVAGWPFRLRDFIAMQ